MHDFLTIWNIVVHVKGNIKINMAGLGGRSMGLLVLIFSILSFDKVQKYCAQK